MFAHWCNTLPHHQLATPRRFAQPWEAQASLALRAGRPEAAKIYDAHNRLHSVHPALLAQRVAGLHLRHAAQGRTVAIMTNTAETARVINQHIQRLNHPAPGRSRVTLADRTRAGTGDQIRHPTQRPHAAHRPRRTRPQPAHLDSHRYPARRSPRRLPSPARRRHPPRQHVARHVELGWAVTGYGNQGDTVDVGIAALEAGTTRNHAYVALTRGRHTNHAYLPDSTGTSDPASQLANLIARPARGDSALATHGTLRGEDPSTTPAPLLPRATSAWPARQQQPARRTP